MVDFFRPQFNNKKTLSRASYRKSFSISFLSFSKRNFERDAFRKENRGLNPAGPLRPVACTGSRRIGIQRCSASHGRRRSRSRPIGQEKQKPRRGQAGEQGQMQPNRTRLGLDPKPNKEEETARRGVASPPPARLRRSLALPASLLLLIGGSLLIRSEEERNLARNREEPQTLARHI